MNSAQQRGKSKSASRNSQNIRLDHHVFTEGEWRRSKFLDHPTLPICISVRRKDYSDFSRPCPQISRPIKTVSKLDSCAQSCLWSRKEFLAAGFKTEDLIPVSLNLSAANKSSIKIDGAILIRINVTVDGEDRSCATMVYVSPSCEGFFMSLEAMLDLGLFNYASTAAMESCQILADGSTASSSHPSVMSGERCSCPARTMPKRPDKLPFPAIPENNDKMKVWLKEYFAPSTFNVCPAKELHEMSGTPDENHLKDVAVPYKAQTAVHSF